MVKLSKLNLFLISVMPYIQDPTLRGMHNGECAYKGYDDEGDPVFCGFGQWIENYKEYYDDRPQELSDLDERINEGIDSILPERLHGYSLEFWEKIQHVHDFGETQEELIARTVKILREYFELEEDEIFDLVGFLKTGDYPLQLEAWKLSDLVNHSRLPSKDS